MQFLSFWISYKLYYKNYDYMTFDCRNMALKDCFKPIFALLTPPPPPDCPTPPPQITLTSKNNKNAYMS